MKLQIRARGVKISSRQLASAERRARTALARYSVRIDSAALELCSAKGSHDGSHVLCRVEVRMLPRRVHAECAETSVGAALDLAIARAMRSIARALEIGWEQG